MPEPLRRIAQADPGAGYRASRAEIDAAVARALGSGAYILAAEAEAFEAEFAAYLGARSALGCASGTDAIVLALRACGVGPGDVVATVSHTAVATVAAIELAGAKPLLLDVDEETFTLDPAELHTALSGPRADSIKAIVAVHLYGQPADMGAICAIASRHGIPVIEDCAQAPGAAFEGRQVGRLGRAGAFSFYPTKNLGALGDGGAVVTDDPALAERVGALRQYGWGPNRISREAGLNSRLDELQAAVLRVKLSRLDADNRRRQTIAEAYDAALAGTALAGPRRRADRTHVFHQYVVRCADREEARRRLSVAGIATAVHYATPVHLQPAYAGRVELGPRGCRTTERVAFDILSLPMHPHLSDEDVAAVCAELQRF